MSEKKNKKEILEKKEKPEVEVEVEIELEETPAQIEEKEEEAEDAAPSLEMEVASLINENLKIRAEYDNFRKRTLKEKERAYDINLRSILERILPVLDNFDRAIDTQCGDLAYQEGMDLILAQFHEVLSSLGVKEIDAVSKPFDPEFHYAVLHEEDSSAEENTVVEVLQKGYILGDTVLRHAMVKVAN